MKTLNMNEIETVSGGINPLILPAVVIYIPNIVTKVAEEIATADQ